ncbi:hypothetical protein CcaCcLH18_08883 [Colletotrichum camelliae]|nr:hypothetical protein CcaCcLH18_08883 [Colletotrichum camelliae]
MYNPYNIHTTFPIKTTAQPQSFSSSSSSWNPRADPLKRSHETADSTTLLSPNVPKPVSATRTRRENRKNEERLQQQREEILTKMQADNGPTRYFFSVFPDGAPIPGITALEDCVYGIRHKQGRELDMEITEAEVSRALELFADQVKWHNASLTPVGTASEECVKGSTADTLAMRLETLRLRGELERTKNVGERAALQARINTLLDKRVRATIEKQRTAMYPEASGSGTIKRATKRPESRFTHRKTIGWRTKPMPQDKIAAWAAWDRIDDRTDARIQRQNEETAKELDQRLDQEYDAALKMVFTPRDEERKVLMSPFKEQKEEIDGLAKRKANHGNANFEEQRTAQFGYYPRTKDLLDALGKAWNLPPMQPTPSETLPRETDLKGKGKAVDRSGAENEAAMGERNLQNFEARQCKMVENLGVGDGDKKPSVSDALRDPGFFLSGWPRRSNETTLAVPERASDLLKQEMQWERKQHWADSATQMDLRLREMTKRLREKLESEAAWVSKKTIAVATGFKSSSAKVIASETVASKKTNTEIEAEANSNELVRKNFRAGFEKWKSENVKRVHWEEACQEVFKANAGVDQTNTSEGRTAEKKVDVPYLANAPMTYERHRQVFPTSNVRNEDPEKGHDVSCNFWASPERQLLNQGARDRSEEDLCCDVSDSDQEPEDDQETSAMSLGQPEPGAESAAGWMHQSPKSPTATSDSWSSWLYPPLPQSQYDASSSRETAQTPAGPSSRPPRGHVPPLSSPARDPISYSSYYTSPTAPVSTEKARVPTSPILQPENRNEAKKAPEKEKKNGEIPSVQDQRPSLDVRPPSPFYQNYESWFTPFETYPLSTYRTGLPLTRPNHPSPCRPYYAPPPVPALTEAARATAQSPPPPPEPAFNFELAFNIITAKLKNLHISTEATVRSLNEDLKRASTSVDKMIQKMRDKDAASPYTPPVATQNSTALYPLPSYVGMTDNVPKKAGDSVAEAGNKVEQYKQEIKPMGYFIGQGDRGGWITAARADDFKPKGDADVGDEGEEIFANGSAEDCGGDEFESPYDQHDPPTLEPYEDESSEGDESSEEYESSDEEESSDEDDDDDDKSSDEEGSSDEEESSDEDDEDGDESSEDDYDEASDEDEPSYKDEPSYDDEPVYEDEPLYEDDLAHEEEPSYEEDPSYEDEPICQGETLEDEPEEDEPEEDEPEEQDQPSEQFNTECCQCANASWSYIGDYEDEACDGECMACACEECDEPCLCETPLDSCCCATCEYFHELGAEVSGEAAVSDASSETEGEMTEVEIDDEDYCIIYDDEDYCIIYDDDRDAEQDDEYEWVDGDDFA